MSQSGWDYERHPGDCHPRVKGGVWTVCCRECAGTGVWPVPWIETVEEGRARGYDDSGCVSCKGTGRSAVVVAGRGVREGSEGVGLW